MSLFLAKDPYPGASVSVKRSLAQVGAHDTSRRVVEAARRIGVKASTPAWLRDAWAHVSFPDLHIAVLIFSSGHMAMQENLIRTKWEDAGWMLLAVRKYKLDNMSDADLERELRGALSELKMKKGGKR